MGIKSRLRSSSAAAAAKNVEALVSKSKRDLKEDKLKLKVKVVQQRRQHKTQEVKKKNPADIMKKGNKNKSQKTNKKRLRIRHRPSTTLITTCSTCNLTFDKPSELLNHKLKFHGQIPICYVCSKGFKAEYTLKLHLRSHGIGDPLFKCHLCPGKKFFSTKKNLREHNECHHGEPRSKVCTHCQKGFSTKQDLDSHVASKHFNFRIACSEIETTDCYKEFTTYCAMKVHVLRDHKKKFKYFCPAESCTNKGFLHISTRDIHLRRFHANFKPFKCSECDQDFILNCDLNRHKILKHSVAQFRCTFCPKVFVTEKLLMSHTLEIHLEGEWGVSCTDCPKKFINRSRFNIHYLDTHADQSDRPVKCSICYKGFVYKCRLRVHERRAHKT